MAYFVSVKKNVAQFVNEQFGSVTVTAAAVASVFHLVGEEGQVAGPHDHRGVVVAHPLLVEQRRLLVVVEP